MTAPASISLTIDVEHDCPPFLTTYRGIEEGMPRLLEMFAEERIPATFFVTGDVARRFPALIRRIADEGHEVGCHGDTHRRFSAMTPAEAQEEIRNSSAVLREFYPVSSFRAPNLDFPAAYLPLLRDAGYRVDSSQGRHKKGTYFIKPHVEQDIARIPASISPSPLRTPGPVRDLLCSLLRDPVVLFFHPWEFVDLTRAPIRFDCRVRTGEPALYHLRETIRYFGRRGGQFRRISELPI